MNPLDGFFNNHFVFNCFRSKVSVLLAEAHTFEKVVVLVFVFPIIDIIMNSLPIKVTIVLFVA